MSVARFHTNCVTTAPNRATLWRGCPLTAPQLRHPVARKPLHQPPNKTSAHVRANHAKLRHRWHGWRGCAQNWHGRMRKLASLLLIRGAVDRYDPNRSMRAGRSNAVTLCSCAGGRRSKRSIVNSNQPNLKKQPPIHLVWPPRIGGPLPEHQAVVTTAAPCPC